jgi:hypothetical protein
MCGDENSDSNALVDETLLLQIEIRNTKAGRRFRDNDFPITNQRAANPEIQILARRAVHLQNAIDIEPEHVPNGHYAAIQFHVYR